MKKINSQKIRKIVWASTFGLLTVGLMAFLAKISYKVISGEENDGRFFTAMVTDGGGINDQSFQQSAWEGMKTFEKETGSRVSYVECSQNSDFPINMDKLADEHTDLIWGIGFKLADTIDMAAKTNPELNYAIADYSFGDKTQDNVTGVVFRSEESSFLAGYVAAMTTKRNCVGFVGGIKGMVIDQFEYGYRAGVAYGAKKLGKNIDVKVQYAESFTDSAKGKAIAIKMFDDCDIIFHAAGGAGVGIIEAAKETEKLAIGADLDQAYLAPKNVLTSALKNVGKAINIISNKAKNGEQIGGKTFSFGLKEECVGISEDFSNMDKAVYDSALILKNKISEGKITPPGTPEAYNEFMKLLPKMKI